MNKFWLGILWVGVCCAAVPAGAEDSLAAWARNAEKPEIQQMILNRIFSGQVGPLAAALPDPKTGSYLFPKNAAWVRLDKDVVYVSSTSTGGPYLVVSCMLYNQANQDPVSATSYIFYDPAQKPTAISGGYANTERVLVAKLSKLNRWFLILVDTSGRGTTQQTSAAVLAFEGTDKPHTVWTSPIAAWNFRFGFAPLSGQEEELVLKTTKHGEDQYSAYHWSGDRFDSDDFASEGHLKVLPDSVWQYGSSN